MTSSHPSFNPAWEVGARAWSEFARSPKHDHFFWTFNGPRFLDLLPSPGLYTLDLACGEGRLGRLLAQRGHRVLGVDASPTMATLAQEAGGQAVAIADVSCLPVASRSVDLVVAFMSLQDIGDLHAAMAEAARVLIPGSHFCFAIAHPIRSSGHFDGKEADSAFTISAYLESRPWPWRSQHTGFDLELPGIHRPLESYTAALEQCGFVIQALREPAPRVEDTSGHPESARWLRIPCFLHVKAMLGGAA